MFEQSKRKTCNRQFQNYSGKNRDTRVRKSARVDRRKKIQLGGGRLAVSKAGKKSGGRDPRLRKVAPKEEQNRRVMTSLWSAGRGKTDLADVGLLADGAKNDG